MSPTLMSPDFTTFTMSRVLAIVHRVISTFLVKRAGMTVKSGAQSVAVTLIQRFGSALNLNLYFHMLT